MILVFILYLILVFIYYLITYSITGNDKDVSGWVAQNIT